MNRNIYLDNNATTKVNKEVLEAMLPYFERDYGNPSSIHKYGLDAKKAVSEAREYLAFVIGANPDEIYFTSGGTESDNWALDIISRYPNPHIVASKIEHKAILNKCDALWREGVRVSYLEVDGDGIVKLEQLSELLKDNVTLVSVMAANNEVGTIEPLRKIGEICHRYGTFFHTDAVAAFTKISINVKRDNIHMLSATAHKIHGPKGVGLLYVSKDVKIEPMIYGGGQEAGFRGGTENVPGIVGFAKAAMISIRDVLKSNSKLKNLRNYMISRLLSEVKDIYLLGSATARLNGNICLAIRGVEGETLLLLLNERGICVSNGSACHGNSPAPSHVLVSLGVSEELWHSTIRISIDENVTKAEIDEAIFAIEEIVMVIREKESER